MKKETLFRKRLTPTIFKDELNNELEVIIMYKNLTDKVMMFLTLKGKDDGLESITLKLDDVKRLNFSLTEFVKNNDNELSINSNNYFGEKELEKLEQPWSIFIKKENDTFKLSIEVDNKKNSDFYLFSSIEKYNAFINHISDCINDLELMKEINMNVLDCFSNISNLINEKAVEKLFIDISDPCPFGSDNKTCTLKIEPVIRDFKYYSENGIKIPNAFYVNMYVTGVLSVDMRTFNLILPRSTKIEYSEKLKKLGNDYIKRTTSDTLSALDKRMRK